MSQKANVCYYSNRCEWSKAFMKELAQTPWANSFSFSCVDAEKRQGPLPAWLKKVPTLVIAGEQQPRTDGDVMNWLSEMRLDTKKDKLDERALSRVRTPCATEHISDRSLFSPNSCCESTRCSRSTSGLLVKCRTLLRAPASGRLPTVSTIQT